ncbi:MAG TPA: porin, partial [Gammaproteobacteria bacterium]|nr:porin [Gammaproteobacteria bacterium]
MKLALRSMALVAACATGMAVTLQAEAANWLMLQGAEKPGTAPRAKLWGFLQPTYRATDGTDLQAGPWKGQEAQFNQIAPQLSSNKQFSIARARIGVRGTGFPLNSKINYFFLAEFGSNGITWPAGGKGAAKITDASVTFNYIPGARIRAGQFKTPGAEEGLQAIHVFDYVNFTNVTNQLLLERFFDSDGSVAGNVNAPNGPVSAFRDIGVQIFDTFKTGAWNTSYALMFGNGNGIARGDNNGELDSYYYVSTEKVFAGQGGRVESLKLFAWYQTGKRTLLTGATQTEGSYDRTRNGLGLTFRRNKIRAAAEYIMADGMIFNGTDGGAVVGAMNNAGTAKAGFNILPEDKANGYYVHFGYMVLPKLELDVRYDV